MVSAMEEEREQIEESLEDLLIFPAQGQLQRSLKLIKTHFIHEENFLEQSGLEKHTYKYHLSDQQRILTMILNELDRSKKILSSSGDACKSN
jgi:hypothetical protein